MRKLSVEALEARELTTFGMFDTPTIIFQPLQPNTVIFPVAPKPVINALDLQDLFNSVNIGSI